MRGFFAFSGIEKLETRGATCTVRRENRGRVYSLLSQNLFVQKRAGEFDRRSLSELHLRVEVDGFAV